VIHGQIKPLFGTPLNRSHWASQGLVAQYLMNEMGGDLVHDSCVMNDGKMINMAPMSPTSGWVPGPYGPALAFDGTDDYADAGKPVVPLSGNNTIIVNFTYNSTAKVETIASQYANGVAGRACININQHENGSLEANTLLFFAYPNLSMSKTGLSINVNYTAALSQEGNIATAYLNGLSVDTGVSQNFADRSFMIGRLGNLTTYNFTGLISSVSIYNRALSAQEIAYLYAFPWCMYDSKSNRVFYSIPITPSINGATIVSQKNGAVYNFGYKNPDFSYDTVSKIVIVKKLRG